MKDLTGWKRKAALLFKSEKRLGAGQVFSSFSAKSYDEMKNTIINEWDVDLENIPNKVRVKDLTGHLNKVKKEFIDQSELSFYHATLVVLLRRGYKPNKVFEEYENLWEIEYDFLINNLSLRWIVSACDTFVDFSSNRSRAAIMMNVVTLINTLKVYETDSYLKSINKRNDLISERVETLYNGDLGLYNGLSYFRIGTDDTLKHMRERYKKFYSEDKLSTTILLSVFDKLQQIDCAYSTVKKLHKDEKTKWWD